MPTRISLPRRTIPHVFWLLVVTLSLQGCNTGASVALTLRIPDPVLIPLPANVGLHVPPEMRSYTYEEDISNFGLLSFEMNDSHSTMFRTVFGAMFEDVQDVETLDFAPSRLDAVIVPRIEDFQVAIPQQTRSDYYEVWVRYSLRLHKSNGDLINQWQVAAYGKANRRDHGRLGAVARDAIQEASLWALRDAAATIAHSFATHPAHQQWLARVSQS